MSISTSGLDFGNIDDSVRIQDDLYHYFNGGFKPTPIEVAKEIILNANRIVDMVKIQSASTNTHAQTPYKNVVESSTVSVQSPHARPKRYRTAVAKPSRDEGLA